MGGDSPNRSGGQTGAVFLSYASEDAPAAQHIAEALRSAGVEVWFDREELRGGDAWDQKIRQQIRECRLFVPIISAHTEARLEGYFRREWKLAVDRTDDMASEVAFLVPVVIDETPNASAHVPERFRHVQWTRLRGAEATPALVGLISKLLAPPSSDGGESFSRAQTLSRPTAPVQAPALPFKPQTSLRPMALITGAAAVAIAGAGYVAVNRFSHRGADTTTSAPITAAATDKSIAVLPFSDLSEKHDQEYLADGMAEEVLDLLAKVPELKVIGRTSSFSFKGKSLDVREIGKSLGAAYVLEGSIRRSGDRLRVTVQLLDARDGSHRWSETFERQTTDVFELQHEIAARTARSLNLTIASYTDTASQSVSPAAYDNYVRGLRELQDVNESSVDRAIALFTRAFSMDSNFSKALEGIATAQLFICDDGWKNHRTACESAKRAADSAIAAAPRSPDAYAIRAELRTVYDWDWAGAEADVRQAKSLGGGEISEFAAARIAYALGAMDRAREHLDNIISNSPFDANAMFDRGFLVEYRSGRFQEAESWIRRALEIAPDFAGLHFALSLTLLAQGSVKKLSRKWSAYARKTGDLKASPWYITH